MRRSLIVMLALGMVMWSTPAWAGSVGLLYGWYQPREHTPVGPILGFKSWNTFLRWVGCDAAVVVWETPNVNAGYSPSRNKIMVMQGLIDVLTPEQLGFVLAHEAGHCMQNKHKSAWLEPGAPGHSEGMATQFGWERDAEAHAVKIFRILGHDGCTVEFGLRALFARMDGIALEYDRGTHGTVYTMAEWACSHDGLGLDIIQAP